VQHARELAGDRVGGKQYAGLERFDAKFRRALVRRRDGFIEAILRRGR
jgi:hypothetical protein